MNIAGALAEAVALGLDRLDAQLLLLHAIGRDEAQRAWLIAHDGDAIDAAVLHRYRALCQRRLAGEPFAYIVGRKEFFGLELQVDSRVLVPRPDTETLVEWALELIPPGREHRVIDLGTGSGAIALALKKSRPDAHVVATDLSEEALAVARGNANRIGLDVAFHARSWLDGDACRYDLIVSNPPYIAEGDVHLAALKSEPYPALASGADGLVDLGLIVAAAPAHLSRNGWLLLEHGHDQGLAVRALLEQAGFEQVATRRDLGGNERCSGGMLPGL